MSADDLTRDEIRLDASYKKALAAMRAEPTTPQLDYRLKQIDLGQYGAPGFKVVTKKGQSPIAGGPLKETQFYSTFYTPSGAVAVADDITAHQAISRLVSDLKNDYTKESKALDRALAIEMEAWFDARNTPRAPVKPKKLTAADATKLKIKDAEIASMYRRYAKSKDRGDLSAIVLGDSTYDKRVKMPKWNVPVSMLREPQVAIRYNTSWGIPTSKSAHRARAEHFRGLQAKFKAEHARLIDGAEKTYGGHGSLISGGLREHFPDEIKNRIRFLAHSTTLLGDAVSLHEHLSKTRSPLFK